MQMLDEIKPLTLLHLSSKQKVEQLRTVVRTHINQEENDIFPNSTITLSQQQKQMATDFKTAKVTARAMAASLT